MSASEQLSRTQSFVPEQGDLDALRTTSTALDSTAASLRRIAGDLGIEGTGADAASQQFGRISKELRVRADEFTAAAAAAKQAQASLTRAKAAYESLPSGDLELWQKAAIAAGGMITMGTAGAVTATVAAEIWGNQREAEREEAARKALAELNADMQTAQAAIPEPAPDPDRSRDEDDRPPVPPTTPTTPTGTHGSTGSGYGAPTGGNGTHVPGVKPLPGVGTTTSTGWVPGSQQQPTPTHPTPPTTHPPVDPPVIIGPPLFPEPGPETGIPGLPEEGPWPGDPGPGGGATPDGSVGGTTGTPGSGSGWPGGPGGPGGSGTGLGGSTGTAGGALAGGAMIGGAALGSVLGRGGRGGGAGSAPGAVSGSTSAVLGGAPAGTSSTGGRGAGPAGSAVLRSTAGGRPGGAVPAGTSTSAVGGGARSTASGLVPGGSTAGAASGAGRTGGTLAGGMPMGGAAGAGSSKKGGRRGAGYLAPDVDVEDGTEVADARGVHAGARGATRGAVDAEVETPDDEW